MNPYFEQQILTVDPIELIGLVYQRALSSVAEAREHLRHKRILERSAAISRAYMALHELQSALQPDVAPELCARLQSLYLYMQQRLLDANTRQEDKALAEVFKLLTTLAEAWAGVAEQLAAGRARSHAETYQETPQSNQDDRRRPHAHHQASAPSYALTA